MLRPERRPRIGLLGKFAIVSLVPIVLLGLALAFVLRDEIRQRALSNARQSATLLELSLVQPQLAAADLKTGLGARTRSGPRSGAEAQSGRTSDRADQGLEP